MKKKVENLFKNFLSFYEEIKEEKNKATGNIYKQYSENAKDLFASGKLAIPNKKVEEYRYYNFQKIFKNNFVYYLQKDESKVHSNDLFECDIPNMDAHKATLVNGWYSTDKETNKLTTTKEGVVYGSLLYAYQNGYKEIINTHLNKDINTKDPLVALNNLFSQDGFFVYIPDNIVVEKPLQLINLVSALEEVFLSPHSLIVAGKNSQIKILLCEHSIFPKYFLNNSIMQIIANKNAHVEYIRLQNTHNESYQLTNTYIHQSPNSNVKTLTVTLHGGVVRNNIVANLLKGSYHEMYGLYLVDKGQYVDNWTLINHKEEETTSRELFKGIIDDYATGAFEGKILVRQDSQKVDAQQNNKNILLTSDAHVYSQPQLEIYADDVICSHGSATGQVDEEQLFYLRARGIPHKDARLMLLNAFAYDVIKDIPIVPLKEEIVNLVEKRLNGDLSRCNKCEIKC